MGLNFTQPEQDFVMKTKILLAAGSLPLLAFALYETRQIEKQAYEIQPDDTIERKGKTGPYTLTKAKGEGEEEALSFQFNASVEPAVWDFVCYASEEDVYHCPRVLFLERHQTPSAAIPPNDDVKEQRLKILKLANELESVTNVDALLEAASTINVFVNT